MQITDLYKTQITCSTYNADIDSTDTVITVTLTDFNNAAVTNKSVTLTCDKGYFTKNGSTSISGTSTTSITATTNSSGQITATWTASEWGLATFSANNNNIQIYVGGYRSSTTTDKYSIKYNDYTGEVILLLNHTTNFTATTSWKDYGTILSTRVPLSTVQFMEQYGAMILRIKTDGTLQYRSITGSSVSASSIVAYAEWNYIG